MKKALLVGINKYPDAPLNGCVNDVLLMYKVLSDNYGFNTNDINVITDKQATKKNILSALKKLVTGLKKDDSIYFHYSGHGSQVVSNDWTAGKEADGRDEIICPIDLDWDSPLRDNDLNSFFIDLPKDVKSTVVLDCCHSGTGLRNLSGCNMRNRYIAPPIDNILMNPLIRVNDNLEFIYPKEDKNLLQSKKVRFLVSTVEQGYTVLISGCKDNQTSADAYFGDRYNGALTYCLVYNLSKKNFKISNKKLIESINKDLKSIGFDQQPQLECPREYFDLNFLM